ncbi:NAD(P)-dependent oxidoreductase [Chitinophaga sp. GbtcB8]|uniref:NAD-dependent epimerase/dehydratase family protein n=1 Tax=Chitinophaga sp. GbtcB8 TaxID=2824753 RepID=UPI001C2FE93B|nr:NAD-dependent epimerase/dehydratase family protein [Chitinophaga sp. GbtcB8]
MKVVVIGGTGHIGTFLIPRLIEAGHQVTVVSRQQKTPYQMHDAWQDVQWVTLDRTQLEENGAFGQAVADLSPQVVIDLICFKLESARQIVDALQDRLAHYLHCGTIWVHGHKVEAPSEESHPRRPLGEYGIQKAAIEAYLLEEVDQDRFPATVLHPGHIVGPGWNPINPLGNLNRQVFSQLANGQEVLIPNLGLETLHHVHADDVAAGFMQALINGEQAIGENFHILSEKAMTWRGYAEAMAEWYGQKANLRFVPWEEFRQSVSEEDARLSWDHLLHSSIGSIEKARRLLDYRPRYSSLEAIQESLSWAGEGH